MDFDERKFNKIKKTKNELLLFPAK